MRYVKPREVWRDPETNKVLGVFPNAFKLRTGEEYLSAAWLEYYSRQTRNSQIASTISAFKAGLSISKNAAFALGNVRAIKEACEAYKSKVRILHEPDLPHLPSHAAVRRYSDEDENLLSLLADTAWSETVT